MNICIHMFRTEQDYIAKLQIIEIRIYDTEPPFRRELFEFRTFNG